MSDEAATVTAETTDIETAATPTPEPPAEPQQPHTRREAKAAAREVARERAKQLYASVNAEAETAAPESGGETEPGPAEQAPEPAEAEPETGPEPIRIEIAEDHSIRAMTAAITVADPESEQAVRALLNGTYTGRRAEKQYKEKIAELQNEIARRDAASAASEKYKETPQYKARVERFRKLKELEEAGDLEEGTALDFWKSGASELAELEKEELAARQQEYAQQEAEAYRKEFIGSAWDQARAGIQPEIRNLPEFEGWFQRAIETFDAGFDKGHYNHVLNIADDAAREAASHREFKSLFSALLKTQPAVQQVLRAKRQQPDPARERELEAARREGAQNALRDGAARRTETPPNPLINRAVNGTTTSAAPEPPDTRIMPPSQLRKMARTNARQLARQAFAARSR